MKKCLLLVTLLFPGFLFAAERLPGSQLSLIYSANLHGELEPCGCSDGALLGGLLRRARILDELTLPRASQLRISAGGLISQEFPTDNIKADFILSGFEQLDYDAIGLQWRDLAYGESLLLGHPLPWVAGNYRRDGFADGRMIERGEQRFYYTQWLSPADAPFSAQMQEYQQIEPDLAVFAAALRDARAAGALTIVGTGMAVAEALAQLPLDLIDILIVPAEDENYREPSRLEQGSLLLRPGTRGQRLGLLQLEIVAGAISGWQHSVSVLGEEVVDAERMLPWYQQYSDALAQRYRARIAERKTMLSEPSDYAGADSCQACHQAVYQQWQGSEHAGALDKLAAVGKNFDPGCVACHSVAFNQRGGFIDMSLTPQLAGVQCENCHGAAAAHVQSAGQTKLAVLKPDSVAVCTGCHNRNHSSAFSFPDYWSRIAHGSGR